MIANWIFCCLHSKSSRVLPIKALANSAISGLDHASCGSRKDITQDSRDNVDFLSYAGHILSKCDSKCKPARFMDRSLTRSLGLASTIFSALLLVDWWLGCKMSWGKRRVGMMAFIATCLICSTIDSFGKTARDSPALRSHASTAMITWCSYNLMLVFMSWDKASRSLWCSAYLGED